MKFNIKQNLALIFGTFILNSLHNLVLACQPWTTGKDKDGIYTCPPFVDPEQSFWGLMECAYQQTNNFTKPTEQEKTYIRNLVDGYVLGRPKQIVGVGAKLNLQTCRKRKFDEQGRIIDSILMTIIAPGYNYNGAFFLVREKINGRPDPYPILMEIPHTDFGLGKVTRAFENSKAAYAITLGTRRISGPSEKCSNRPASDAAHSVANGFYTAHVAFVKARPDLVVLHLHGMNAEGMIIANGFAQNPGPFSLLFAAAQVINDLYPNKPEFRSCAEGTPLRVQANCGINQAWVEVRQLTCSVGPQCKDGTRDINRIVASEMSPRLANPNFLVKYMDGLANGYLKTRGPVQSCDAVLLNESASRAVAVMR